MIRASLDVCYTFSAAYGTSTRHPFVSTAPPANACKAAQLMNVIWRSKLLSEPTTGVDSSFCTPCEVLRFAAYVYST